MLDVILAAVQAPQVSPQVTPQVERLLAALEGAMSRGRIQAALGLRDRKWFAERYLLPALRDGYVEIRVPTHPARGISNTG